MQSAANTSRFVIDLSLHQRFADSKSVVSHDGSLQDKVLSQLAHSANSHQVNIEIASRVIRLAEHFYSARDMKRLEEASRVLMNLPLSKARQIGLFYQALYVKRAGHWDNAELFFETVADQGPLSYRARAIQALGALHYDKSQPTEALRFHLEAARANSDGTVHNPLAALLVQLQISQIQAHIGDHERALAKLENIAPLVRDVAKEYPLYFYSYNNSLAVVLAEVGRFAEAEAASTVALASPFAAAYPEYAETRDEIAAKRQSATRSVVAINRAPEARRAGATNPSPQAEPKRQRKQSRKVSFRHPASGKASFQRSTVPIPVTARATIAFNDISILNRVLMCIGPRAPPTRA